MKALPQILFLSTHNLATNPRLVKEIQLAIDKNYRVEVICFTFHNWSFDINKKMVERFTSHGVVFHCIESGRSGGLNWLLSVAKEKYYRFLLKRVSLKAMHLSVAVSRRSSLLLQELKKIKGTDWVIGHNPGALYPTYMAAKYFKCKAGFDVEDYHPGEGQDVFLQKITRQLMQVVLPKMNYVSFAAPLIREAVKNDLGKEGSNWITVLNYFSSAEFIAPANIEGPLKLVWFSQNISAGRGLEYILPVLQKFPDEMELHLFGNLEKDFYEAHLKDCENVIVHNALPQIELHTTLSHYDVGLALEPKKDINNDLAISNKVLAYLQAGLFVIASDTEGQLKFLNDLKSQSYIVDLKKVEEIKLFFSKLIENANQIRINRTKQFQQFRSISWELESKKIIENLKLN